MHCTNICYSYTTQSVYKTNTDKLWTSEFCFSLQWIIYKLYFMSTLYCFPMGVKFHEEDIVCIQIHFIRLCLIARISVAADVIFILQKLFCSEYVINLQNNSYTTYTEALHRRLFFCAWIIICSFRNWFFYQQ